MYCCGSYDGYVDIFDGCNLAAPNGPDGEGTPGGDPMDLGCLTVEAEFSAYNAAAGPVRGTVVFSQPLVDDRGSLSRTQSVTVTTNLQNVRHSRHQHAMQHKRATPLRCKLAHAYDI